MMTKAEANHASREARDALVAAVEALTAPQTVATWQGGKLRSRTDPPLLDALRAAIGSTVGMGGGGGALGSERNSIDYAAFTLFEQIDGRARAWMLEMGAQVGKELTPSQVLRSWITLWNATHHEPADHDRRRRVVDRWADAIENVIDPPRRIDLGGTTPVPCPACGEEYVLNGHKRLDGAVDQDEAAWARALAVFERGRLEDSFAACGACGVRWEGENDMRWLRVLIDEAEATRALAEAAQISLRSAANMTADALEAEASRRGDPRDASETNEGNDR